MSVAVGAESARSSRWQGVVERMFEELRGGAPRAETYWVQQLAFGPVFPHAVLRSVRDGTISAADLELLRRVVPTALLLLGPLPDGCDGDPHSFFILARRQAEALAWGRRRLLTRLGERLGLAASPPAQEPVPRRFQRPYELIGWRPPGFAARSGAGPG